jgi:hypothetical protein
MKRKAFGNKTSVDATINNGDVFAVKVRDFGGARGFTMKITSKDGQWNYKLDKPTGWQAYLPLYMDRWWAEAGRTSTVRLADAQWPVQAMNDPSLISIWPDDRHNNVGYMCLKIAPGLFQKCNN